jgi:hypothetical protein
MQKSDVQKRVKDDILKRIKSEEDYIRCKKFSNSLNKFLAKFSEGCEDSAIARVLMIPEEEVQAIYSEAVKKLRAEMVEKDED